jgi:methylmalonyl-CoA mutase
VIHDAGGSEAQELAYVLAVGVAYLRALEDAGIPLEDARRMIYARLSADADQFLTMAKFRALRLLWARIEQSCGLTPEPLFVVGETAWRMLTQRDPDVNMLRATIAAFSAGLGGANSVSVLPHTLALGLPDAFARRIARNTQLVLLEESNLDKVSDPAAGSGGIETLTKQLCEAAWSLFQDIEKAGGAFAALEKNIIQPKVAAVRAARDVSIAKRKDILTGASEFPISTRRNRTVLDAKPAALPWADELVLSFDALTPIRLAAPFEELRDRSDDMLAKSGKRRRCSSPISAPRPISPRAPPSPRVSLRPAASKHLAMTGSRIQRHSSQLSRPPAQSSFACVPRTRFMRRRLLLPRKSFTPLVQSISIWLAVPAIWKPPCAKQA